MDAAQKLFKTSAILLAIALSMAAPGWAQTPTLVAPASVVIGSTTVSDPVSVTSSAAGTTEITYTIGAPDYTVDGSGSRTGWLNAPSGTFTTPTDNLIFRIPTLAQVNSGATARITLTPTAPASAVGGTVTITVSFNGSGTSGNVTLTANPASPISLTAALNNQVSTTVAITASSASNITISVGSTVTSGGVNWLSAPPASNSINSVVGTTLTIVANAFGLTAG